MASEIVVTLDELVERLRKYDWHVHTSEGSKPTDIPLQAASQLLAMKKALELMPDEIEVFRIMQATGGPRAEMAKAVGRRIEEIRAILPTSAADKIAEGGPPNSGGRDA